MSDLTIGQFCEVRNPANRWDFVKVYGEIFLKRISIDILKEIPKRDLELKNVKLYEDAITEQLKKGFCDVIKNFLINILLYQKNIINPQDMQDNVCRGFLRFLGNENRSFSFEEEGYGAFLALNLDLLNASMEVIGNSVELIVNCDNFFFCYYLLRDTYVKYIDPERRGEFRRTELKERDNMFAFIQPEELSRISDLLKGNVVDSYQDGSSYIRIHDDDNIYLLERIKFIQYDESKGIFSISQIFQKVVIRNSFMEEQSFFFPGAFQI